MVDGNWFDEVPNKPAGVSSHVIRPDGSLVVVLLVPIDTDRLLEIVREVV